jgi:hypothetical protein
MRYQFVNESRAIYKLFAAMQLHLTSRLCGVFYFMEEWKIIFEYNTDFKNLKLEIKNDKARCFKASWNNKQG